ncbi:hypothetical protein KBC40_02565 [Patescibacteria group bacterium]|nr:hypothetical protein [Patescibacteria group bacterium]
MFTSNMPQAWYEAMVRKFGSEGSAQEHLEKCDGVIYRIVTSDNTTGPEWCDFAKANNLPLSTSEEQFLRSDEFKPTDGVTYYIAIIKGLLFEEKQRHAQQILDFAAGLDFIEPSLEVDYLVRRHFSAEMTRAMGLKKLVTMHAPIPNKNATGRALRVEDRHQGEGLIIDPFPYTHDYPIWIRDIGFVVLVGMSKA